MFKKYRAYLFSLAAGVLLLFIPLLKDLHFESAMLAAVIGCYWGAFKAARDIHFKNDLVTAARILSYLYTAAIPLFIYALANGCLTFDGFGFWILTPAPSVFLGVAAGRLCRSLQFPAPRSVSFLILTIFSIGIFLWQLTSFPQVFFFNHVWGHWPGPIYDESVTLPANYILFRFITLQWILVFWILPDWNGSATKRWIFFLSFACLLFSYLNYAELDLITPEEKIRHRLGDHIETEHFNIYFSSAYFDQDEIRYQALKHEFYLHKALEQLEMTWPDGRMINSYLYPHAWNKKAQVGAKFTSYVPVWLRQDQLHIAKQQLNNVLYHEIVHVVSKQFGNMLFNGSYSTGLIEGLAEAIAKNASQQSTLHQIVASQKTPPTAEQVRSTLSLTGFYSDAGAVSYTTMGSFSEYLLENYPAEYFKSAYPNGNIQEAYGISVDSLVAGWHRTLTATQVDSTDRSVSELIFAQRSLFEKKCPHSVPERLRLWDEYRFRLADLDTSGAYQTMDHLHETDPGNPLILAEWMRNKLQAGEYAQVIEKDIGQNELLTLKVLSADALYMSGNKGEARTFLDAYSDEIAASRDQTFRYTLEMRKDTFNWNEHTNRRYRDQLPDIDKFNRLTLPNKLLSLQRSIDLDSKTDLILYSASLLNDEIPPYFFGTLASHIDKLIWLEEYELSEEWIIKLQSGELRARYRERTELLKDWLDFRLGESGN